MVADIEHKLIYQRHTPALDYAPDLLPEEWLTVFAEDDGSVMVCSRTKIGAELKIECVMLPKEAVAAIKENA